MYEAVRKTLKEWLRTQALWVQTLLQARNDPRGFTFAPCLTENHYMEIGKSFHDAITSNRINDEDKRKLIAFSEEHEHVFHNAAVLWLESRPADIASTSLPVAPQAKDKAAADTYNTFLSGAEMDYAAHLKWLWIAHVLDCDKTPASRRNALVRFLWDHTALGKVIVRRATQFHSDGTIQTHPGYWGLYLFSPRYREDVGLYDAMGADARWFGELGSEVRDRKEGFVKKFRDAKATIEDQSRVVELLGEARIHEFFPRRFAESGTAPGVYLHRPFAHGRDEFLVCKRDDLHCMVACTKGVGADGDLVPKTTAGQYHSEFFESWTEAKDTLPFSYSSDEKAGSWRGMGFCLIQGNLGSEDETEVASIDFRNFAEMYDHVCTLGRRFPNSAFAFLQRTFVEPFICIQLTSLKDALLSPAVLEAIRHGTICHPVEVVTCAPQESSLRMDKQGKGQDYDYGHFKLEADEWARCLGGLALDHQLTGWRDEDARMNEGDPTFARRVDNAYKHVVAMLGSYVALVSHGWATDRWTSSLAGRNFNGGPRDAHMWGTMTRQREDMHGNTAPGYTAHVDLDDLTTTLQKLLFLLHFTTEEVGWLKDGCNLLKFTAAVQQFAGRAKEICNGLVLDEPSTGGSVQKVQKALGRLATDFRNDFFPTQVRELFTAALP